MIRYEKESLGKLLVMFCRAAGRLRNSTQWVISQPVELISGTCADQHSQSDLYSLVWSGSSLVLAGLVWSSLVQNYGWFDRNVINFTLYILTHKWSDPGNILELLNTTYFTNLNFNKIQL